MEKVRKIANLFLDKDHPENITESDESFKALYETNQISIPATEKFIEMFQNLESKDVFELSITLDETTTFNIYSNNISVVEDFIADLKSLKAQTEEGSKFTIEISISKSHDDLFINLYNYNAFVEFLNKKSFNNLLHIFNRLIINEKINTFIIHDQKVNFSTSTLNFENVKSEFTPLYLDRSNLIEGRNEICHFNQSSHFQLLPQDFYLIERPEEDLLSNILDKITVFISITFLADLTEIEGDNSFHFKINGYKTVSNTIDFKNISIDSVEDFKKIVEWTYNDGNINDKIGLARNILTLTLDKAKLTISENAYTSILSNYKIYLKKNVEHYITVKNKISDHLVEASKKAGEIVEDFQKTFRNNFFAFFSFFFTVLIIRVITSGDANNIFTKEIALISFAFLATSLVYLTLTVLHSFRERSRFDTTYLNLKDRYKFLFNEDDLNSIFSPNNDHQDDLKYIKNNILIQAGIWILVIFGLTYFVNYLAGNILNLPF